MAYKKGESGNPTGRKLGTLNRSTKEVKSAIEILISKNTLNIQRWIKQTAKEDPAKAVELIIELSKLVIPRMQVLTVDSIYEKIPDEQLNYLLDELINKQENGLTQVAETTKSLTTGQN